MTVHARALPPETDDPRDTLLDLFEHQVRALLAAGLEPQARARLGRLLPPATPPATAGAPLGREASVTAGAAAADDAFSWSQILVALRYAAKAHLTEAESKAVRHARELVLARLLDSTPATPPATAGAPLGREAGRTSGATS